PIPPTWSSSTPTLTSRKDRTEERPPLSTPLSLSTPPTPLTPSNSVPASLQPRSVEPSLSGVDWTGSLEPKLHCPAPPHDPRSCCNPPYGQRRSLPCSKASSE